MGCPLEVVVSRRCGAGRGAQPRLAATGTPWVAFLDDDVQVSAGWRTELAQDLESLSPEIGGVQGRSPCRCRGTGAPPTGSAAPPGWRGPGGSPPTWPTGGPRWSRPAGSTSASRAPSGRTPIWRCECWPAAGTLATGRRGTVHPVRDASPWISVRAQAGNADDALMRAVHGPGWYERAGERPGRRDRHMAITTARTGRCRAGDGGPVAARPDGRRPRAGGCRAVRRAA